MKIKSFIFGKERTLLSFNVSHYKNTNSQGKPLFFTLGSEKLHIRFVQEQGDEAFLNWMLLKDENTQEYGDYERGKIVIYDNLGLDKKLQEYDFIAKPIACQSVFHHEKGLVINMTLSADKMLVYNDKFYIKPYYYPKEHTEQRKERHKIKDKLANSKKVKYCYKTSIEVLKGYEDYSNGATYWHGKDFAKTNKPAHKDFYLKGFLFTDKTHDKCNLGDKEVEHNKKTWKYKYKSTAMYANTTFMTLTEEWKEAVGYKKANGN